MITSGDSYQSDTITRMPRRPKCSAIFCIGTLRSPLRSGFARSSVWSTRSRCFADGGICVTMSLSKVMQPMRSRWRCAKYARQAHRYLPYSSFEMPRLEKSIEREMSRITEKLAFVSASYSRSEEHTSELQSLAYLVCRLLLE